MLQRSDRSHSSGLVYYSNFVVDERRGTATVWHVAALEFGTMALVPFFTVRSGASLDFHVMTRRWVKVVAEHSSLFLLAFAVALIIKALRPLSPVVHLIHFSDIWCIVDQTKSIGRLWTLCPIGYTASPMAVCTTWSTCFFRHGREMQVGELVWIDCILLQQSSAWQLPRNGAPWRVLSHTYRQLPEWVVKLLTHLLYSCFSERP